MAGAKSERPARHEPHGSPGNRVNPMQRPQCTAKARNGAQCKNPPMKGATTCRMHGSANKRSRAAAERRIAEADARAALAYVGSKEFTDPIIELGKVASEVLAMKDALAARVNALSELKYETFDGREHLRVEVELYERALDRSAKFLEALSRTGFEERRIRVEESYAAQLVAFANQLAVALNIQDRTDYDQAVRGTLELMAGTGQ